MSKHSDQELDFDREWVMTRLKAAREVVEKATKGWTRVGPPPGPDQTTEAQGQPSRPTPQAKG